MSTRNTKKRQPYFAQNKNCPDRTDKPYEPEERFRNIEYNKTMSSPNQNRTPPQTPPRPYRSWADMMDSPTPPHTPPRTPGNFLSQPATPNPRSPPRTPIFSPPRWKCSPQSQNDPYVLPSTPQRPTTSREPATRTSPKARTPTRTRLAIQKRSSPNLGALNTPPGFNQFNHNHTPTLSANTNNGFQLVSPLTSQEGQVLQLVLSPQQTNPSPQQSPPQQALMLHYAMQTEHLPPSLQQSVLSQYVTQTYEPNTEETPRFQYQFVTSPNGQFTLTPQLNGSSSPISYPVITTPEGYQYIQTQPRILNPNYGHNLSYSNNVSPTTSSSASASLSTSPNVFITSPNSTVQQITPSSIQHHEVTPTTPTNSTIGCLSQVANKIYIVVEFKRGRALQYQASFWAQPGGYVIVEGDNGEDLGMVVHTWLAPSSSTPVVNNSLNSNRNSNGNDVDPITGDPIYPKVLRNATSKEVQHLHNTQAQAEIKCTEMAKQKVIEHGLPMTVVDAEYQFDRQKLTFYYDASERIDFRELVRDLYKLYRARIWMSKTRSHDEEQPQRRNQKK